MTDIKRKHSKQREAIRTHLMGRCDHPTADDIYQSLRLTQPRLSLGTVYRNLSLLAELGDIQRITTGDGREHFDGNPRPHDHFLCRKCGAVKDIPGTERAPEDPCEIPGFSGLITDKTILYGGYCQSCRPELS